MAIDAVAYISDDELLGLLSWRPGQREEVNKEWMAWAKVMVCSAKCDRGRLVSREESPYLCRLMRVLEGVYPTIGVLESVLRGAFASGVVLSGVLATANTRELFEYALLRTTQGGQVILDERDEWNPGMRSGSGWREYYRLTPAGQRLADESAPVIEETEVAETTEVQDLHQLVASAEAILPSLSTDGTDKKGEVMAINDSLINAHEYLLRVIPKPLTAEEKDERARTGKGFPDVDSATLHDATRRFVDALSTEPAMMAELERRGVLCVALTGEGSDYLTAKTAAHEALRGWKPEETIVQKLTEYSQNQGDRDLVVSVRDEYDHINLLLGWDVPATTRTLLEAWRDAAWSIVSKGENESLDGCWWLLHTGTRLPCMVAYGASLDIRQAADALVRWLNAPPIEDTAPVVAVHEPLAVAVAGIQDEPAAVIAAALHEVTREQDPIRSSSDHRCR